jgi:hypothetical protein
VNGTRLAPSRIIGSWAARQVAPNRAIEAADTIEVNGSQCRLLGTGSIGSDGRLPPTSRKLQRTGALKPCPVARRSATIE